MYLFKTFFLKTRFFTLCHHDSRVFFSCLFNLFCTFIIFNKQIIIYTKLVTEFTAPKLSYIEKSRNNCFYLQLVDVSETVNIKI
jgi:hypothetical protein